jgi:hypothetical protein
MSRPKIFLATAPNPGAVALLYVTGERAVEIACRAAGKRGLPDGRAVLARFGEIDEGLVQKISSSVPRPASRVEEEDVRRARKGQTSRALAGGPHPNPLAARFWGEGAREECVLLMPHAGPRVVQRLIEYLVQLGAQYDPAPDPVVIYPEAGSAIEAHMLWTLAHCPSPWAVDLLLDQPELWAKAIEDGLVKDARWRADVLARSRGGMRRWLSPGSVVIAGVPNVGKSTLTNRVLGRSASIVAAEPGTTRDWVGGLAVLEGLAVRWLDTPGVRATEDLVERQAIEMARGVIQSADVQVVMNEPGGPWPVLEGVTRRPDLYVTNKADDAGAGTGDGSIEAPLRISAASGMGVERFLRAVVEKLGVSHVTYGCWAFCPLLIEMLEKGDASGVREFVGVGN